MRQQVTQAVQDTAQLNGHGKAVAVRCPGKCPATAKGYGSIRPHETTNYRERVLRAGGG